MQFNVSQLLREPIGSRRRYLLDERSRPPDGGAETSVEGPVELLRTDKGILVSATLSTVTAGECDRCLVPVKLPLRLEFEVECMPSVDPVTGFVLPRPDDPDVPLISPQHILDLTDTVRQAWLLARPMQMLCRPDCPGLCPDCGQDRNAGACRCEQAPIDSRWAALAALRPQDIDLHDDNHDT